MAVSRSRVDHSAMSECGLHRIEDDLAALEDLALEGRVGDVGCHSSVPFVVTGEVDTRSPIGKNAALYTSLPDGRRASLPAAPDGARPPRPGRGGARVVGEPGYL